MSVEQSQAEAIAEGRALSAAGDHLEALRHFATALERHGESENLLTAAADVWVVAVDAGARFEGWDGRHDFHQRLIRQGDCDVSPPIFQHRNAAQHSSGVQGHLAKAAGVLEPALALTMEAGSIHRNDVLMLLLLRSFLNETHQQRISELHRKSFSEFSPGDLALPYSVMFEPTAFNRNISDLADLATHEGSRLLDGSVPLIQLLLLQWLVPDSLSALPGNWAAQAIRARYARGIVVGEEAAAARSLVVRLGGEAARELAGQLAPGESEAFAAAIDHAQAVRAAFLPSDRKAERARARIAAKSWTAVNAARNLVAARAPTSVPAIRRRPKVAVCISGQLRGFRATWSGLKRTLLAGIDATVFVDSWMRIGRSSAEPFRYVLPFEGKRFVARYREIGIELGLPALEQRYPALFANLAHIDTVTEAELAELYDTPHVHLDDERDPRFIGFSNPEKMHFKIEACHRQVLSSGERFDLIVRIRPDKPAALVGFDWADMVHATARAPLIYCESAMGVHYANLSMGDQFAVGSADAMRVYAETFSRADGLSRFGLHLFHRELTGHVSLAHMCWLHGIAVHRAPVRFGPFQDPAPLSSAIILAALETDSFGRNDAMDRKLIDAVARDISAD